MSKTKNFIEKAKLKHNNLYDYSKTDYVKYGEKVTITCKLHGDFKQLPSKHLTGQGCPECGKSKISNSRKDTKSSFIKKAIKAHDNFYKYNKVDYINSQTKITIICPIHGEFEQTPAGHLSGKGCPKCRYIKSAKNTCKSTEEFINEANLIHNNKYNYDKTIYTRASEKVIITCPEHGDFEQKADIHLRSKGCAKCGKVYVPSNKEFIERANKLHSNKYDYSKVSYTNMRSLITITCPIHGTFEQTPVNHLKSSSGCPSCSLNGFDYNKSAILYYLKVTTDSNKELYKIGITNRTVQERFNLTDLKKIEIIKQRTYENGKDAYDKEQEILKKYSEYRYTGEPVLQGGNTELFSVDITKLTTR